MNVLKEIAALWVEVKRLKLRLTESLGGVTAAVHLSTHQEGGDDEIDVTTLGGFTGDPADVLRGDGTFGPALGAVGAGQWIPATDGAEPLQMISDGNGHPVLVWWEGP